MTGSLGAELVRKVRLMSQSRAPWVQQHEHRLTSSPYAQPQSYGTLHTQCQCRLQLATITIVHLTRNWQSIGGARPGRPNGNESAGNGMSARRRRLIHSIQLDSVDLTGDPNKSSSRQCRTAANLLLKQKKMSPSIKAAGSRDDDPTGVVITVMWRYWVKSWMGKTEETPDGRQQFSFHST